MFPYTFAVVSDGSKTWNRWLNRVFALMKGPVSFWRCASNPESFCFFRYWWMRFFWNKPVRPKLSVYQYWRLVYLPLFKRISGRWTELFRYQLNHKGDSALGSAIRNYWNFLPACNKTNLYWFWKLKERHFLVTRRESVTWLSKPFPKIPIMRFSNTKSNYTCKKSAQTSMPFLLL